MWDETKKTVLVVGATKGFGYGAYKALETAGFDVRSMQRTRGALEFEKWSRCDLNEPQEIMRCLREWLTGDVFLDGLVFCASARYRTRNDTLSMFDFVDAMRVNVWAPLMLVADAIRYGILREGSPVILLLDVRTLPCEYVTYTVTKGLLNHAFNLFVDTFSLPVKMLYAIPKDTTFPEAVSEFSDFVVAVFKRTSLFVSKVTDLR